MAGDSHFVSDEVLYCGEWLTLKRNYYQDPNGVKRSWEVVERARRRDGIPDGVMIVPILKRTSKLDCFVCVQQYRPPLKTYTLEFPAGLTEEGESVEQTAMRELWEETGYLATDIKNVSPLLCADAGIENSNSACVTVEINGDEISNQNPKQHQDAEEFIKVILIPCVEFLEQVKVLADNGLRIDTKLYFYALGQAAGK